MTPTSGTCPGLDSDVLGHVHHETAFGEGDVPRAESWSS